MKQSFRQRVRPWLIKHPLLYHSAKSTHRKYCKLTSSLHTLPDFLIIGAAKCGTSSLYDYLIRHPSIFPCIVKEPNYFAMYYDRGDDWYKSCFPSLITKYSVENIKNKKFLTGEASTQYYWYPHAAKRAKKLIPNAKLIVLLRNPIDRAYSHYNMNVGGGKEHLSFEDAIVKEHERIDQEYEKILKNENYFSPLYTLQAYLTKGIYINYLKNWMKFFPKEQFCIIKSEDFFKKTNEEYNKLLQFLKLPNFKLKQYKIIRPGTYEKMNPKTRENLIEYYKPFNKKLYDFLGIDFDWDK